jgi:hypothetical protein
MKITFKDRFYNFAGQAIIVIVMLPVLLVSGALFGSRREKK